MTAVVRTTVTLADKNTGEVVTYHGREVKEVPDMAKILGQDSLQWLKGRGEAEARVSVSMDMKDNNYGKGFGAHVSVSLACEQTEETVSDAVAAATAIAEESLPEAFERASVLFEKWVE